MTQGGAKTSFNQFSERDVGDYIDLSLEYLYSIKLNGYQYSSTPYLECLCVV